MDIKRLLNILNIIGICFLLAMVFWFQWIKHIEPCPLCLLQRLAFLGTALSLLMNLRFDISTRFYALAIFNALFGMIVALRQIAVQVIPGTFHDIPFLGFRLFTWSFFAFLIIIFYIGILLFFSENKIELKSTAK